MKTVKSIKQTRLNIVKDINLLKKIRLKVLFFLVSISFVIPGINNIYAQQLKPKYISISEGIASPVVQDIIQDSYGLLWVATINGLQKYDGYKFQTFKNVPGKSTSLQNNNAWGLEEDENHNIWVGNDLGISKYDRKHNVFVNYSFSETFNLSAGGGRVFNIFKDSQNRLWATSQVMELVMYKPSLDKWVLAPYDVPDVNAPSHTGISIAVTEDANGGIWFGSSVFGLMYMPKTQTAFSPIPASQLGGFNFIDENFITSLFSDSDNILWITTRNGIYKYNPQTATLKTIKEYDEARIDVLNHWNRILQDQQGNIWIGNNFRGILKFDGITDNYKEFPVAGKVKMRGRGYNITITDFIIDRSGIFWFGSREFGLLKYDPVNKPFSYLSHDTNNPNSISGKGVFGLLASKVKPGIIYVGIRGGGLNIYDSKKNTFKKVTFKVVDDTYGGSVRSIAEDNDGSLWLGTWGDGLIKLDAQYNEVKRYKYVPQTSNSISDNQIRVIKKSKDGKMWVGTNNGLNIFDPSNGNFNRIIGRSTKSYPEKLIEQLEKLFQTDQKIGLINQVKDSEDITLAIDIINADTYWVMAVGEGDANSMADIGWIENSKKDTIWHNGDFEHTLHAGGGEKNRLVIDSIYLKPGKYFLRYKTDESHAFNKWNVAAPDLTSLYGIALLKPKNSNQSKMFQNMIDNENKRLIISGNNIADIQITDKYIWVSANGHGLNRIDPENITVKYFVNNPVDENSLISDVIYDIFEDSKGYIWLATTDGINKLDPKTEIFTRFTEEDGLPTNLTESILEGDDGEMWISTENGLSQMVTNEALEKTTFINYNSTDGLGGDIFLALTADRAPDGRFYFGGNHGLTTFKSINSNSVPPSLIISDLLISNKSVRDMGDESPLTGNLLGTDSIVLAYNQNNLSLEFAALHFANPLKNQYAHKLIGYDKDWIYDNRNFASYTNLDPGNYQFAIRASNAYGIWNEKGKSLSITISPPWWHTWWAYMLYFLIISLGIFGLDRFMRNKIKLKEKERSREKELEQAKEIEKAYTHLKATQSQLIQSEKMASLGELTAGIAHEIQNPLNFVNNFSEVNTELIDELSEEVDKGNLDGVKAIAKDIKENEQKINHHGKRAEAIVKGMLQHSRSNSGEKEPTDINALADEYLRLAYHGLRAKNKSFNATMKSDFDNNIGSINIIPQDIGRVILNLITNAFYAVNEKNNQQIENYQPTVSVSTKKADNKVIINVADNGNGIPQNVVDKIFQPFFTTKPTGQGTGLGLSMSYDIITKGHEGELKVETKEREGTTFIIEIPI